MILSEVVSRRGGGVWEKDRGSESNGNTLQANMEMS
jgi:hypothetical protein